MCNRERFSPVVGTKRVAGSIGLISLLAILIFYSVSVRIHSGLE